MKKVLMLAALVLGAGCFAENLLVNGDMKTNKGWNIWGSAPKDPAIYAKTLTYVNEGPNGTRVLKFADMDKNTNSYLHQEIALKSTAKKYVLTFKAKAAKGQKFVAGAQIFAKTMNGKKADYKPTKGSNTQQLLTGTGDWKEYKVVMSNISADTNTLSVVIYPFPYSKDTAKTGSLLVTDVVLEAAK